MRELMEVIVKSYDNEKIKIFIIIFKKLISFTISLPPHFHYNALLPYNVYTNFSHTWERQQNVPR